MKTLLVSLTALFAISSVASAAPHKHKSHKHHKVVVVKKTYGHKQAHAHSKESAWGRPVQKVGQ